MALVVKASAPGRLDFLNTHQDYKGLPVVSVAINMRTIVTLQEGDYFQIESLNTGEGCVFSQLNITGRAFCDYVKAAVVALEGAGVPVKGLRGVIDSQVPIGAGMASSAAMLVALIGAAMKLTHREADSSQVAELAYIAEREILGVPCGRLDQYGSAYGRVAVIHPTPPVRVEQLDLPHGVFLVLDSGLRHSTAEIHPRRQAELRAAVDILKTELGVKSEGYWDLPWATLVDRPDAVERLPSPLRERVLFTIEMQKSTERALELLRNKSLATEEVLRGVGREMLLQHRLLSELYDVSLPRLDRLVEEAVEAGAYGAKLSGAGLGGVVIALTRDRQTADAIARRTSAERWWIVKVDEGLRYGD